MYTHALDRDTLLYENDSFPRIDKQLNSMVDDARLILAEKDILLQDKFLLNGFSASASFANRFTALYPERVAAVAAGGINCMTILPMEHLQDCELIYPVGIADIKQIAELEFQLSVFADVPQYYYMGAEDKNDTLPFDDAFSQPEREIIIKVLGEDMGDRWEKCKIAYESQTVHTEFRMFPGVGHETTAEMNAEIVKFFMQVMNEYN